MLIRCNLHVYEINSQTNFVCYTVRRKCWVVRGFLFLYPQMMYPNLSKLYCQMLLLTVPYVYGTCAALGKTYL